MCVCRRVCVFWCSEILVTEVKVKCWSLCVCVCVGVCVFWCSEILVPEVNLRFLVFLSKRSLFLHCSHVPMQPLRHVLYHQSHFNSSPTAYHPLHISLRFHMLPTAAVSLFLFPSGEYLRKLRVGNHCKMFRAAQFISCSTLLVKSP